MPALLDCYWISSGHFPQQSIKTLCQWHWGIGVVKVVKGGYQSLLALILIPTVSTSGFHSINLFLFSHHHIYTKSVAPFPAYKYTHATHNSSIHSDEGLMLETSALKLFTVKTLYIINSVDNTKLP